MLILPLYSSGLQSVPTVTTPLQLLSPRSEVQAASVTPISVLPLYLLLGYWNNLGEEGMECHKQQKEEKGKERHKHYRDLHGEVEIAR